MHSKSKHVKEHSKEVAKKKESAISNTNRSERPAAMVETTKPSTPESLSETRIDVDTEADGDSFARPSGCGRGGLAAHLSGCRRQDRHLQGYGAARGEAAGRAAATPLSAAARGLQANQWVAYPGVRVPDLRGGSHVRVFRLAEALQSKASEVSLLR